MINLKKKNKYISDLLEHSYISTKISIYMATRSVGEDYDPYEKVFTHSNLNPLTIKGYCRDIRPESLVWRQIGISEVGAKEILCEDKYVEHFRKANKIEIDGDEYQVYKENVGNRVLITKIPFKLIKVVLRKK
jgi:hypothetical protein